MRFRAGLAAVLVVGALCVAAPPEAVAEPAGGGPASNPTLTGWIDGAFAHTCAVVLDDQVKCWGLQSEGELGNQVLAPAIGDDETAAQSPDVLLSGRRVRQVAGGQFHTCALVVDGSVRCWGLNNVGQLGLGNTTTIGRTQAPSSVPAVPLGRPAVQVTAGYEHSCALLDDGAVRCWGMNGHGQLGLASSVFAVGDGEPVDSVATVDLGAAAVAVSAGREHTCAVLAGGLVRCWGANEFDLNDDPANPQVFGKLGFADDSDDPSDDVVGDDETPASHAPVDLGGEPARAVTTGEGFTCVIVADGSVRCWGENDDGELGLGHTTPLSTPGPHVDLGGHRAVAISAGGDHVCALLDDQTLRCWGANVSGQLGRVDPSPVGDDETPAAAVVATAGPVAAVGAGDNHTCALLVNGTVQCWGANGNGRLGLGQMVASVRTPTTVPLGVPVDGRPVAHASASPARAEATVNGGTARVRLDASGSSDPVEGTALTYRWSGPVDPADVVAPEVEVPAGEHRFTVTVTDLAGVTATASVDVVVSEPPVPFPFCPAGYWMLEANGEVHPFGTAGDHGDATAEFGTSAAVDIEPTPSGLGYWLVNAFGRVEARGDAVNPASYHGPPVLQGETVSSISSTPTGNGFWLFTTRGRALAYGDAGFFDDMSGTHLNGPVRDSIPTPSGQGYYMVASDGGIFAFGDAVFRGSMGAVPLTRPVRGLVPDPDGVGYWLVASDGGVFAFDADFRGSMGGTPLARPVNGMVAYFDGYLMVAEDGGIFNFSNGPFVGSLGASPPANAIVSAAVHRTPGCRSS